MERDFMGLKRKHESRNGKHGSAMAASGVQWPFANKVSTMQQYMSYRERQNMSAPTVDQFPSSRFQAMPATDAFESSHRAPPASAPQKCINFDRKNVHQYPIHVHDRPYTDPYQANEARNFSLVSRFPVPLSTSSPFLKLCDSRSGPNIPATPLKPQALRVGETVMNAPDHGSNFCSSPRGKHNSAPTTAQLTIFYTGVVNVYDDVPLEQAQEIMLMARRRSNTVSYNAKSEPVVGSVITVPSNIVPAKNFTSNKALSPSSNHVSSPTDLSSPLSVSSHARANSGNGSSSTDGTGVAKTASPLALRNEQETMKIVAFQQESSKTVMPKAVPQARKASLARFLEKRKERVINLAPYSPCSKKTLQTGLMFESTKMPSTSLAANIHPLKNHQEDSWSTGRANGNVMNNESPSTELEM